MTVQLVAFAITDPGRVRNNNEDAFLVAAVDDEQPWPGGAPSSYATTDAGVLLAVSDGMGGAAAGEVASAITIRAVFQRLRDVDADAHDASRKLREIVKQASHEVHEAAKRPSRRGMGATLTAVWVRGSTAHLAQIGDSRAYLLRDDRIVQVTHDQSWVQELVDRGVLTPEEAERSPQKNMITQVMGQRESLEVALGHIELRAGDRVLVCSDGLSNVVSDDAMRSLAAAPARVDEAAKALVHAALEGGGPDNITVVVAELA